MSRVFEALTKASHEKEHGAASGAAQETAAGPAEPLIIPVEGRPEIPISSNSVASEPQWEIERNGKADGQAGGLIARPGAAPRTWRERLEELLFGWDLRRYSTHPIIALEEDSPASEQYKILREQLRRLRTEAGVRTIAVTSPIKRDGKTTVAVNLAAAMALEYEEKVLLIDADLRAPSIHRFFGSDGASGLTDYLSSNATPPEAKSLVCATHLSGLQMIAAGRPSRFASELLSKEKMRRLIDELRRELPEHTMIIDSPPVLATPDPLVLARQVDGIIMVIRAGRTPKDYLVKALSSIGSNKVLGVVLNAADMGFASKYYYYYSSNGRA